MTYNKVKFWIVIVVAFIILPLLNSCKSKSTDLIGNWVRLSDFDGVTRSGAVGFVIGDKGYIGTGFDGDNRLADFWEYDPVRNAWTQKADFPGVGRNGAFGFGTDTKGYIGTGYDGKDRLSDFYEFDPSSNSWTKKADFAGPARLQAWSFAINNLGYVTTGDASASYMKDVWQYDPSNDTWTQKTSIGGQKRKGASGFVISGKAYIAGGIDNGSYVSDFWMYDPSTDTWTKKRAIQDLSTESYDDTYTTITGQGKVGFAINGKGYLATGGKDIGAETWEYDPTTDLWTQKTSFEGSARTDGAGFAIGDRGYVTTGRSSGYYFDDIWAFEPNAAQDSNDN